MDIVSVFILALAVIGWLSLGLFANMQVDEADGGRVADWTFLLSIPLWPITVPIWCILIVFKKRRIEEMQMNLFMGGRWVGYRPQTVAPEDGPPTKKPTPIKDQA